MPSDSPIWMLIGIIVAGVFFYGLRLVTHNNRPRVRCPHCGAGDMQEIRREPVGSRTVQPTGGGTPAGGDIRLQLDYKVTYRCNNCHKETMFTVPKTF